MRNEKGQFVKGFGFWTGKKRPGLKTSTTFAKGIIPWNQGKKMSNEAKSKMSLAAKKRPSNFKGKKHSPDTLLKMSLAKLGRCGSLANSWRGGITKINKMIRNSEQQKMWIIKVFERDNYTCVFCQKRNIALHADHIKPFAVILRQNNISNFEQALNCEELWDINNGRALCVPCHKETDSYMGNFYKNNFHKLGS